MWIEILLFVGCLGLVALAAAAQAAFSHLNAARLRRLMQQGASRSQALSQVVHDPGPIFSSVAAFYLLAVGTTTVVVLAFVRRLEADLLVHVSVLLAAAILALIAQSLGRGLAALRPEPVALVLYGPLQGIALVTSPLVRPWDLLAIRVLRLMTGSPTNDRPATTEEDLRLLVDAVEETDALEEDEREMITSIFELSDREIREIMIPRVDIVAVAASMNIGEAARLVIASGHSRVPVFEEDLDHIVGLVHLRDLAECLESGRRDAPVGELARPGLVVPESKKIDEMLRELQLQHVQMALVADEYGGTAGLVTIEDLLEEIVGEIHDETDVAQELITRMSDHELDVDARVSIHDVNEELGLELDDADYDTLGGLVVALTGRLPSVGDSVFLDGCEIRVLSVRGRRVGRVHVTLKERV